MKRELLDDIWCPACHEKLSLAVVQEEDDEIVEGTLRCGSCGETYPIEDSIPNLLPPDMRDSDQA